MLLTQAVEPLLRGVEPGQRRQALRRGDQGALPWVLRAEAARYGGLVQP